VRPARAPARASRANQTPTPSRGGR
jgi:hypothetical protein